MRIEDVLKERLQRRPDAGELDCVIALLRVPEVDRKPLAKLMKSTPAVDFAASSSVRDSTWKVTSRKSDKYTFHDLAIEAEPKNAAAHQTLAEGLENVGRTDEARRETETAKALQPDIR